MSSGALDNIAIVQSDQTLAARSMIPLRVVFGKQIPT
jgi:hypothetical protein